MSSITFDNWDEDFKHTRVNDLEQEYLSYQKDFISEGQSSQRHDHTSKKPYKKDVKYQSSSSQFDLLKVLGKGGYGKVLLAKKNCGHDAGALFAIKIMKKAILINSQKDTIHTRSERNILEKVKHKYIVDLIYAFQTNDKLYLVMEYVAGGELYTYLEREGVLSESAGSFYLAELVLALEYLHLNDVVYRDLKPENILISLTGDIKLADFGLCKDALGQYQTHSFCGTIEYMAPEIVTRSGHSYYADWWSLGALMFDILIGHPPFSSDDRSIVIEMILKGHIDIPSYLSHEARDLLNKLLVRNPEDRLGFGTKEAVALKSHPFFQYINFYELINGGIRPPFVPQLKNKEDTSLFDSCFSTMSAKDTPCTNIATNSNFVDAFNGFTYVAPSVLQNVSVYENHSTITCVRSMHDLIAAKEIHEDPSLRIAAINFNLNVPTISKN